VLSAKIAGLGESFTISCEANADPPPKFSIFYNNTKLISTEKTYVIPKVNSSHIGFYKCAVENAFGSKNSTSVYLRIGEIFSVSLYIYFWCCSNWLKCNISFKS
jgi:hypothetical protein